MKKKFFEWFKWFLICIVISMIVTYGWQGLELLIYGEIQRRLVDDIVGTILMLSVILNVVFIRTFVKFIKGE